MKRSKLEMYMDFLSAVAKGDGKTTTLLEANVNSTKGKIYLQTAARRGEVVINESKKPAYAISEGGLKLLEAWKEYRCLYEELKRFLGGKNEKKQT